MAPSRFRDFRRWRPDVENDDGARDPTERARDVIFFSLASSLDPPRDARDADPRRDGAHRRRMSAEPRPRGFARDGAICRVARYAIATAMEEEEDDAL